MAVCPVPPLLGPRRGSIGPIDAGGVTATNNQHSRFCRSYVTPTDTITPRRSQERSEWTAINTVWLDLTRDEHDLWIASAAEHSGGMTARNWFWSINQPQQLAHPGVPPVRVPPPEPNIDGFYDLRLVPPNPGIPGVLIEFDRLTPPPPVPSLYRPTVCRIRPVSPTPTPGVRTWLFNNRLADEIPSHATSWFFPLPAGGPAFLDQIYPSTLYRVHVRIIHFDGRRSKWQQVQATSTP